jgi:hypothetical protein
VIVSTDRLRAPVRAAWLQDRRREGTGEVRELLAGALARVPELHENPDDGSPSLDFQVCDSKPVDLNGDGLLDFAAADHLKKGFGYFMQDPSGDPAFAEGVKVTFVDPGASNSAGIVAADYNFDGIPDIANSDHDGAVSVRINATPPGSAITAVSFPASGETTIPLGLNEDIVVVPLDITSQIAVALIENTTEPGTDIPSFALVDIIYLPERMQEVTFFDWLFGESDGDSPEVWFASTGNVADFDNDGKLDIVAAIAKAGFAIEAQSHLQQTDNILEYVVPPINLDLAMIFLPRHTELIQLRPTF